MEERKTILARNPFKQPVTILHNGEPFKKLTFEELYFPKPGEPIDTSGEHNAWEITDPAERLLVDCYCAGLHAKYPRMKPGRIARKAAEAFKLKQLKPTTV